MPSLLLGEIIAYQEAYPTWAESTMKYFNSQFNERKRDSCPQHSSFSVSLGSSIVREAREFGKKVAEQWLSGTAEAGTPEWPERMVLVILREVRDENVEQRWGVGGGSRRSGERSKVDGSCWAQGLRFEDWQKGAEEEARGRGCEGPTLGLDDNDWVAPFILSHFQLLVLGQNKGSLGFNWKKA